MAVTRIHCETGRSVKVFRSKISARLTSNLAEKARAVTQISNEQTTDLGAFSNDSISEPRAKLRKTLASRHELLTLDHAGFTELQKRCTPGMVLTTTMASNVRSPDSISTS